MLVLRRQALQQADTLTPAMRAAGAPFGLADGFLEGALLFPPTCHYVPQTGLYMSDESSKLPAWRDRVLCHGDALRAVRSYSCSAATGSTHKAVGALVEFTVHRVDPGRKAALRRELREMCEALPPLPDGSGSPKPGSDDLRQAAARRASGAPAAAESAV